MQKLGQADLHGEARECREAEEHVISEGMYEQTLYNLHLLGSLETLTQISWYLCPTLPVTISPIVSLFVVQYLSGPRAWRKCTRSFIRKSTCYLCRLAPYNMPSDPANFCILRSTLLSRRRACPQLLVC